MQSRYRPRSAVYTEAAFAVVFRGDASGVVAAAIRVSRNRRNLRRSANALEPLSHSFGHTLLRRDAAGKGQTHMAKLIQICASQNDLFGLDGEGVVYHYNFNTNSWMRLGSGKHDGTGAGAGEDPMNDRFEAEPVSRRDA